MWARTEGAAVAAGQEAWCTTRNYLIQHRTQLAKQAIRLYDPGWQVPHTSTLAAQGWLPCQPIPIEAVTLDWEPRPPRPVFTGREAELRPVLPLRTPRYAFPHYTSAMRYLSPPRLFENRPSYRLLDVSLTPAGQGQLRFGLGTFFDKLDVSEALGHEFAAAAMDGALSWTRLPFRALLSQPFDLSARTVTTSIATLTVRRDTTDGSATFFLLWRDPTKVAVGGGQYGVVPAGEFQPASIAPDSVCADLDLWCNIVREYSEELLGQPEHDGSSGQPLDYDCWPFYRATRRARELGQLRAYVLGVVLHALGLNAAILTAVVIDDVVFDDIFRDLVNANADYEPLGGTSAACLALALRHRTCLLSG